MDYLPTTIYRLIRSAPTRWEYIISSLNRIVFLWPALQEFYNKKDEEDPSAAYDADLVIDREDIKFYKKMLEFL